jgi:hypothetical protein
MFLGAAAALAVIAPGLASADTNAVVGLRYTNSDANGFDWDRYGGTIGVSRDLNNGSFLQFDGAYERLDFSFCCYANGYGAAHWGARSDSHSIAGFVTLQDWFGISGIGIGGEGTLELQNIWLDASVSFVDFSDIDADATSGQIGAGWNITENVELTALVSHTEFENGGSTDWTTLGIGGEFRPDNSPVSFLLNYRNADFDGGDVDSWTFGVNFDLNTGTLRQRRTQGPGLTGARDLYLNLADLF